MSVQHADPHIVGEFDTCQCNCPTCLTGPGCCICPACDDEEHDHSRRKHRDHP